jgi:hypothetical protein
MTLTGKLAKNMKLALAAQQEAKRDLLAGAEIATKRHDQAAAKVKEIDEQLAADPDNEELLKKRDEYDRVREGLYATAEYARGLCEQVAGKPDVDRHDSRDIDGQFVKKHSIGHLFRKIIGRG